MRGPPAAWHAAASVLAYLPLGLAQSGGMRSEPGETHCRGTWSEWSNCSQDCGPGMQSRLFTVNDTSAESEQLCAAFNGTAEVQVCNLRNCSVDCEGTWSDWDRCNATCGGGSRSRVYSILRAAEHGGNESTCTAAANETEHEACNMHNCSASVDCLGEWGSWGSCMPVCGDGNRSRYYTVLHFAANNGTNATCNTTVDGQEQVQVCNDGPCPIDCVGSWGHFSNCSAECGLGTATSTYI